MQKKSDRETCEKSWDAVIAKYRASGLMTHAAVFAGILGDTSSYVSLESVNMLATGEVFFDLASMTKALGTTLLVVDMLASGHLSVEATLGETLPAGRLPEYLQAVTVRELLTHRSGLPEWRNFWIGRLDPTVKNETLRSDAPSRIEEVFKRYDASLFMTKDDRYSDLNFILLGYWLEVFSGRSLEELWQDFVGRLGLTVNEAPFFTGRDASHALQCVPTAKCALRDRVLKGDVHDENAASLGGVAGHAGLFGSMSQVVALLEKLQTRFWGRTLWERCLAFRPALGFRYGDDEASSEFGRGKAVGHYGFTGTAFWIEPESKRCVIALTNRVCSGRINPAIKSFRKEIFTIAEQYLTADSTPT